jgi:hypothetical protein
MAPLPAFLLGNSEPIRLLGEQPMLDLILLALGAGLFALMATYAAGCERV